MCQCNYNRQQTNSNIEYCTCARQKSSGIILLIKVSSSTSYVGFITESGPVCNHLCALSLKCQYSRGFPSNYCTSTQKSFFYTIGTWTLYHITIEIFLSPILHTMGTLMSCLGKKHWSFLTLMLQVSQPHTPNKSLLLSVTNHCKSKAFWCRFVVLQCITWVQK